MSFLDMFRSKTNGKARTTRKKPVRNSRQKQNEAGKKRKAEALAKAAEKRAAPRRELPGTATGPKKKTQAERDASLRTNRQKAKAPAKPKAPAKAKPAPAKKVTGTKARVGVGSNKTISAKRNGKTVQLANVSAEQLKKTGLSLRQYMNKWNKTGKRPT